MDAIVAIVMIEVFMLLELSPTLISNIHGFIAGPRFLCIIVVITFIMKITSTSVLSLLAMRRTSFYVDPADLCAWTSTSCSLNPVLRLMDKILHDP